MKKVLVEYLNTIQKPYGGLATLVEQSESTLAKMLSLRLDNVFLSLPGVTAVTAETPSQSGFTFTKKKLEETAGK